MQLELNSRNMVLMNLFLSFWAHNLRWWVLQYLVVPSSKVVSTHVLLAATPAQDIWLAGSSPVIRAKILGSWLINCMSEFDLPVA